MGWIFIKIRSPDSKLPAARIRRAVVIGTSIHFYKFSLEIHRSARVSPFTLTT
jgi:hypothetical protein